ncbi:peptidylprolyl isomerase [Niallia sp. 01092]|uniref:peptidylprolyl isomerase n=1 Tax=unclassified Niallia TaxID=2837522 RepID=UPI003FCF4B18
MKKWLATLGLAAGVLSLSACSASNSDTIVQSKAGNITEEEFYNELKDKAGSQVLKQMVSMMLLEEKYKVTDQEIKDKIADFKKQSGGEEVFKQQLKQNGFKDEKELKKYVKQELLAEKAAIDGVKISENDVKKEFENKYKEEIKASHILVADEKTAKEVKVKLDKGEDFASLANGYSIDTGTKANGGDLGYFVKGKMVPEFDAAAFSLKINQISGPIKTQYGYHIIKVTDKKTNKLEDKKAEIEKELKLAKAQPLDATISKLQKEADVTIEDKELEDVLK